MSTPPIQESLKKLTPELERLSISPSRNFRLSIKVIRLRLSGSLSPWVNYGLLRMFRPS